MVAQLKSDRRDRVASGFDGMKDKEVHDELVQFTFWHGNDSELLSTERVRGFDLLAWFEDAGKPDKAPRAVATVRALVGLTLIRGQPNPKLDLEARRRCASLAEDTRQRVFLPCFLALAALARA